MTKGIHIVIEGLANNKTELLNQLYDRLQQHSKTAKLYLSSQNQHDTTSQMIAELVNNHAGTTNQTKILLANAGRSQNLATIERALAHGMHCLQDTSYLSQIALHYYGLGITHDYQRLQEVITFANGDSEPDIMLVLDTPVAELSPLSTQQLLGNYAGNDDAALLERMRAGYLWEANQRNIPVLYAGSDSEATVEQIWQQLLPLLPAPINAAASVSSIADVLANQPLAASAVAPPIIIKDRQLDAQQGLSEPALSDQQPIAIDRISHLLIPIFLQAQDIHLTVHTGAARYEEKDSNGHFRYYLPDTLKGKPRSQYIRTMNQLFGNYAHALTAVTDHIRSTTAKAKNEQNDAWLQTIDAQARIAVQPLLPLAACASGSTYSTASASLALAKQLTTSSLAEAQNVASLFSADTVSSTKPDDKISRLENIALDINGENFAGDTQPVQLASYIPRNELDIAPAILYGQTDVPLRVLQQNALSWPYQRKLDIFDTYMRSNGVKTNILKNVRYTFDVMSAYETFLELLPQFGAALIVWQSPTPRLGYATTELIEDASLSDMHDDCFDLSLQLHSLLQTDYPREAAYATLLGHKLRWNISCDANDIIQLSNNIEISVAARQLVSEIIAKITEVHPLLANTSGLTTTT